MLSLGKLPLWDRMNEPHMGSIVATEEQIHLYDQYGPPLYYHKEGAKMVVRVPIDVQKGFYNKQIGVMMRFAGGGTTTNSVNFPPWFKTHTSPILATLPIVIEVYYELLPEHSGAEAHSFQDKVYEHIHSGKLEAAMRKHWLEMHARIEWEGILVVGESAGCHWADYLWMQHSEKVKIKVLYNMYPMIDHYVRRSDDKYRGSQFSEVQLRDVGLNLLLETARGRPWPHPVLERSPPEGMANLPLTATRTLVVCNGGAPRYETFWFLCWQHLSIMDRAQAWMKDWLENVLKSDPEGTGDQSRWRAILEGRIEPSELNELETWVINVHEGRIELTEGSEHMDESHTIIVDAGEIFEKLGPHLLHRLGLVYLSEQNALSCTVPQAQILRPLDSPLWIFVQAKEDSLTPTRHTDMFSKILRTFYGDEVVHWERVVGSEHGFDNYPGSKQICELINHQMEWFPRDIRPT